jgi:hypothetical protein
LQEDKAESFLTLSHQRANGQQYKFREKEKKKAKENNILEPGVVSSGPTSSPWLVRKNIDDLVTLATRKRKSTPETAVLVKRGRVLQR